MGWYLVNPIQTNFPNFYILCWDRSGRCPYSCPLKRYPMQFGETKYTTKREHPNVPFSTSHYLHALLRDSFPLSNVHQLFSSYLSVLTLLGSAWACIWAAKLPPFASNVRFTFQITIGKSKRPWKPDHAMRFYPLRLSSNITEKAALTRNPTKNNFVKLLIKLGYLNTSLFEGQIIIGI